MRSGSPIKVSTWATVVALPFGIAIAYSAGARASSGASRSSTASSHLPLILPPVVTGYLLLLDIRAARAGRRLSWPSISASSSHPLDGRCISLRGDGVSVDGAGDQPFNRVGRQKTEAAAGNARPILLWVFATITLPLDPSPGIIAGMILSFAKAMGEFGATITFVSNIPRRDADPAVGHLHFYAGAGRRSWRAPG